MIPQLPLREAVAGEAVDDAERVTEVVIEARTDNSGWQGVPHVADALSHLIPGVGNLPRVRTSFQVDENGDETRPGEAAQEVQMGRLLQLALEPLSHLLHRLFGRCPRPGRLNDHGLDGEGGILVSTKPEIRQAPGDHGNDHDIDDKRAMPEGPVGEIEPGHGSAPSTRTFWPG